MNKSGDSAAREHRLAAKLRENLHRRKAQARARAAEQDAPADGAPSPNGEVPLKQADDSDSRT